MKLKVRMLKDGYRFKKGEEGYIAGYGGGIDSCHAAIVINNKLISSSFDKFEIIEEYLSSENKK